MRRARIWIRRLLHATGVAFALALITAAITIAAAARTSHRVGMAVAPPPPTTTTEDVPAAKLTLASSLSFAPQPGATAVPADAPVVVHAAKGTIVSVRVVGANGVENDGKFLSSQLWMSQRTLAYGTTYRATAMVSDGTATVERSATFTTSAPAIGVTVSAFPNRGLTVGVGQPVVLRFSRAIADATARAAVLKHFRVTVAPAVKGGWYWFSHTELHFRPQNFWPAGEKVSVAWDLTGWNAGDGAWGVGSGSTHFSIGPARVSLVDLNRHTMTVTVAGQAIAVFPISGGKPKDPTMNGVHIVLDREHVVHMVSSTVGIPVNSPDGYDELVYDDVHISDSGEYVHAAPWSVASQGVTNVSHGCVNLSPADAHTFFLFSRVGDVVLIQGSPRPPELGDHGVMDWDTGWTSFTPATVIAAGPPRQHAHAVR